VAVVRMSKVVSVCVPLFRSWMDAIFARKSCSAFFDVVFSPVSEKYAVNLLLNVGRRRQAGIYHCSGADDVSYLDFVRHLALAAGAPNDIVIPQPSATSSVIFRPTNSALGMTATRRRLTIGPQPLESVVTDLWSEYHRASAAPAS
jgi:dTDP-4-dehydrorhamnose reductase